VEEQTAAKKRAAEEAATKKTAQEEQSKEERSKKEAAKKKWGCAFALHARLRLRANAFGSPVQGCVGVHR
jgi:hypothetical protein